MKNLSGQFPLVYTGMGVLDGTSGTPADVPGVGLKMVSVLFWNERCGQERGITEKFEEITKNIGEKGREKVKKVKETDIKSIAK